MIKLLLAKKFDSRKHDPSGMMMSEKIDGVRAFWDSKKRKLFTRNGNEIQAPPWFTEGFPEHDCDGELHSGRGNFQKVQGIARQKYYEGSDRADDWREVRYAIFDDCGDGPFKERYKRIRNLVGNFHSYLHHFTCASDEDLMRNLKFVEENGGEGMMLRDPESKYERRRSSTLLKVKRSDDSEAKVIDLIKGHPFDPSIELLGAIVCELSNGVTFRIGSWHRSGTWDEVKKGDVITFRHFGFTDSGVPRFATYLRTRARKGEAIA